MPYNLFIDVMISLKSFNGVPLENTKCVQKPPALLIHENEVVFVPKRDKPGLVGPNARRAGADGDFKQCFVLLYVDEANVSYPWMKKNISESHHGITSKQITYRPS